MGVMKGDNYMDQAASIRRANAGGSCSQSNVAPHWGALVGGGALALLGLTRRSKSGMALAAAGGLLAYAGAKANSPKKELVAQSSVQVNCSPEQAYQFWRNFENLPLFMRHLESVTVYESNDRRSRWIAVGPLGSKIKWDAEIVSERENQSITWRSLPGSDLNLEGSVEFQAAPRDRGTLITVRVHYLPPAGAAGHTIAKFLGKDPSFLMRQDLRRFKALIETGEIPTIVGQTHGPRSTTTAVFRILDPDQSIRGDSRVTDVLIAKRRAS
jgi:uncharacterized membrane protein